MDLNSAYLSEEKPELALKSSQIHVQRLKKLKQKLSFQTPQMSHYGHSREQNFVNTKFTISRSTYNNLNPFEQTFRKEQNSAPNKSNYFQSMNLKNIQSQNKILYKKIQKIVKRKTKNLIVQQRSQQRISTTTFENYQDSINNDALNVTSDLAEDMIKNRATRSMIKQQQIRNDNLKMLQRLMTLKPTIQTKKILNQTRKQKQISKRMSKFNSSHTIQSEKDECQKDQNDESINFVSKRFSLDNNLHIKSDSGYQIPSNLVKRQHISSYHERTYRLLPQNPNFYKRTNTQPIQSLDNIRLPTLSPQNSTNLNYFQSTEKPQQEIKRRGRSQNLKYIQTSKNFSNQKTQFHNNYFPNRSNSTHNILERDENKKGNLFKAKKALQRQKVLSQNQINERSPNKFILLGEIQKKIQNLNVRFRFVRFNSYYEIQIGEKRTKNNQKKNDKPEQKSKQFMIKGKYKAEFQISHQPTPSSQPLGLKKKQYQKRIKSQQKNKKIKLSSGVISLQEQMGSALFSSFDYDYHRIAETCLTFNIGNDNRLSIDVKDEFKECSRQMMSYHQGAIRQNDQNQEEDSMDSAV